MTTNPSALRSVSRYLALAWFGLVGLAALAGAALVFLPNEASFVFGPGRTTAYAVAFVLVVAVVGLPLLVIAALIARKAGS